MSGPLRWTTPTRPQTPLPPVTTPLNTVTMGMKSKKNLEPLMEEEGRGLSLRRRTSLERT